MYINKDIKYLVKISSAIASKKFNKLDDIIKECKEKKIKYKKLYECILQVYLFCGFPSSIEGFKMLKKHYKGNHINNSVKNLNKSGMITFKKIYTDNYKKVIRNVEEMSKDLSDWMILEGYGKVLSRRGLTLKERELINVSILSTNYFPVQLYSHIKGSLNCGLSKANIERVIIETKEYNTKRNIKESLKLLKLI
ncbi:MAG TPA: carboxymuconolactone decarboxylase family protein [Ignavibacteria bacterium]|nr:carboxymuconolactone decarboxylase family protein [Ignavibacteria bacterium]